MLDFNSSSNLFRPYDNLHPPYPSFSDRIKELRDLEKYLLVDRFRFLSISGEAGVGKTTLAQEFVHRLKEKRVFHSIVWTDAKAVELGARGGYIKAPHVYSQGRRSTRKKEGTWVESLEDLYRTILEVSHHPNYEAKGSRRTGLSESYALRKDVLNWLGIRRILVVIDDLDSWEDWGLLSNLIEKIPHPSAVLITTRRSLNSSRIPGLAPLFLGPLSWENAKDTLQAIMREFGLQLDSDEQDEVLRFADGNPLIIKLIIALLSKRKLLGTRKSVAHTLRRISKSKPVERFLFEDLYQDLTREDKRVLLSIAVLTQRLPPSPDLIPLVAELSEIRAGRLDEILDELRAASFIDRREDDNNPVDMHELARNFILGIKPKRTQEFQTKAKTILQKAT